MFFLTIIEESSGSDEDRSYALKSYSIAYDDILIEQNKTPNGVENDERQEKQGDSRSDDECVIGK